MLVLNSFKEQTKKNKNKIKKMKTNFVHALLLFLFQMFLQHNESENMKILYYYSVMPFQIILSRKAQETIKKKNAELK